jgi:hypothetical protein
MQLLPCHLRIPSPDVTALSALSPVETGTGFT